MMIANLLKKRSWYRFQCIYSNYEGQIKRGQEIYNPRLALPPPAVWRTSCSENQMKYCIGK